LWVCPPKLETEIPFVKEREIQIVRNKGYDIMDLEISKVDGPLATKVIDR
jgi:hypothetical protein